MPLTFPLTPPVFQDRLRIMEVGQFRLSRSEMMSGTGSGQVIVAEIAPPMWTATFGLMPLSLAEAAQLDGLFEAIGSTGRVYLYDPGRPWPQSDPGGTLIAGANPTVMALGGNNRSFRLAGLPAHYALTAGDLMSVAYGEGRRALFRLAENVAASGAGSTPVFDVSPHLPAGLAAGAAVTLRKPTARFIISSWDPGRSSGLFRQGMTFSAIEVKQ